MKKFVVVASLMVVGVTAAFASSLSVPFFLDNGPNGFPPATGNATFIALHNNTSTPKVVSVVYFPDPAQQGNPDGSSTAIVPTDGPFGTNTFYLPANASFSFRPVADDGAEGGGQIVPNMSGGFTAGSAALSWEGASTDVQGRLVQITSAGNRFGFLLPPGV